MFTTLTNENMELIYEYIYEYNIALTVGKNYGIVYSKI